MKLLKKLMVTVLSPKVLMHVRALDHYINGEHELRLLKNIVDPNRDAIDAGANIGTYSYFLSRYAKTVYAYEPNPELASNLISLMPDVKVKQTALSDRIGEIVFSIPVSPSGRQQHELASVAQNFSGNVKKFKVPCSTIDFDNLTNVGFIKIDVEQHEREVLRGALSTIEKSKPVLLIEVYPLKYNQTLREEFNFIFTKGYSAWFYFKGTWRAFDDFDDNTHAAEANFNSGGDFMGNNLIFFPDSHPRSKIGPLVKL